MRKRATVLSGGSSRMKMKYGRERLSRPPVTGSIIKASDQSIYGWILFFLCELCKSRNAGGDSVDILGLAQFRAQVMFGVLRHVATSSALVLNLAQNAAQFCAQFRAQDF